MTEKKSCSCMADIKHKHREEQEYKQLVCRLNRIEGQVRGIKKNVGRGTILCGHTDTGQCRPVGIECLQ